MKSVSTELLAKLQAGKMICFTIIDMCIDGTWYYYTDCDIPLEVDGHIYNPAPLQFKEVHYEANTSISSFGFKISSNTVANGSTIGDVFLSGSPRGGVLIARLVFLNESYYSAYAANILINPGFETGVLGDWGLTVGSGCTANASVVGSGAYQGTYCAKITITDGWGVAQHVKDLLFKQNISGAIDSGTLYDFSFAAKAAASRKIAADVGARTGQTYPMFYNISLTTSWQFFNLPFVSGYDIGAGSASVNFYLARETSNDDVYIDSVRFSSSLYPMTIFRGTIDTWSWDEEWVDANVVCALAGWNRKTVRLISQSCRWLEFKGAECRYSGAATACDRTYERCEELGNTAHFGGFRWLPRILGKTLWWGKYPYHPLGVILPELSYEQLPDSWK